MDFEIEKKATWGLSIAIKILREWVLIFSPLYSNMQGKLACEPFERHY